MKNRLVNHLLAKVSDKRSIRRNLLLAAAFTFLAFLARLMLAPLDGGIQYITFFPAVAVSAVVGGFEAGLLSSVLGALLASYFFWPPYRTFAFSFQYQTVLSNSVFIADALLISLAVEAMHRYYRKFALAESHLRLASNVLLHSIEGVLVTDASGAIQSVNPAFTRITGYAEGEVLGKKPSLLRSDHHETGFYQALWESLLRDGNWEGEIWNRRKNGELYMQWTTISAIPGHHGAPPNYVAVFHDITEARRKDEHIRHLAFHDALTGLPNRMLFQERLAHAVSRSQREQSRLSVTFIDLDGFKGINDTLGHDVGDLLLKEVAERIAARMRRGTDTVARLGGDEFVVLMEDLKEAERCACLAGEIIADISQPIAILGHTVRVGASMGMAFYPEDGSTAQELMRRADTAMYAAKDAGKGTYRFFRNDMLEQVTQRITLEEELRHAIGHGELVLHYQPKICVTDGKLRGVEALVRWAHPSRGLLPPSEFLPIAEESDLILMLGDWVLAEACRQAAAWYAEGAAICVAINVSARQIIKGDLIQRVAELIAKHGIPPVALQIELTESALMADSGRAIQVLEELRQLGISIAVDDFGTGYSSLSRLRSLPIDLLKIDRSFVMNAPESERDAQVVRTIIALANNLGLDVIAEGVESETQAAMLRESGCTVCQGYLYGHPQAPDQVASLIHRQAESIPVAAGETSACGAQEIHLSLEGGAGIANP
jgi:diguanylate cyclase (GGDEF)-like protein/PAS domain S-box-containing protein